MSPWLTGNGTGTPPMIPWRTEVYFSESTSASKECTVFFKITKFVYNLYYKRAYISIAFSVLPFEKYCKLAMWIHEYIYMKPTWSKFHLHCCINPLLELAWFRWTWCYIHLVDNSRDRPFNSKTDGITNADMAWTKYSKSCWHFISYILINLTRRRCIRASHIFRHSCNKSERRFNHS